MEKVFLEIVMKYEGDRYCKKLSCSQKLAILLFVMIKDLTSLRDISASLKAHKDKWVHIGVYAVARIALSDALAGRSYQIFEELFLSLCHQIYTVIIFV